VNWRNASKTVFGGDGCFGDNNDLVGRNGWVARTFGQIAGGPNSVINNPSQIFGGPNSVFNNPGPTRGRPRTRSSTTQAKYLGDPIP